MSLSAYDSPDAPALSLDTLKLFAELLAQVSVSAKEPEFDAICLRISRARRELSAALEAATKQAAIG